MWYRKADKENIHKKTRSIIKNSILNNSNSSKTKDKIAKVISILGLYVAFDFEWDPKTHILLAALFVDNIGNKRIYLNTGSEVALIERIIAELLNYKTSMGWNSSSSKEHDYHNTNQTFTVMGKGKKEYYNYYHHDHNSTLDEFNGGGNSRKKNEKYDSDINSVGTLQRLCFKFRYKM